MVIKVSFLHCRCIVQFNVFIALSIQILKEYLHLLLQQQLTVYSIKAGTCQERNYVDNRSFKLCRCRNVCNKNVREKRIFAPFRDVRVLRSRSLYFITVSTRAVYSTYTILVRGLYFSDNSYTLLWLVPFQVPNQCSGYNIYR